MKELRVSSVKVAISARTAYLVTLTEETLNGKLRFLCRVSHFTLFSI